MKYQKELTNKLRTDIIYPITVLNAIRLTDEGEGFLTDLLNDKVDKDGAKVLSTNDYTTAEKTKLYGIEAGADVNQNAFSVIKVTGQPDIPAEHEMENLTFIAGSNITLTTNPVNKTVSIAATGTLTGATNATDVTIADAGGYYSSGSVEGALQEVATTKINKQELYTTANITYYVATTGSNSNDGSAGSPFLTLAYALSKVPKNVKHIINISVASGTYAEQVYLAGFYGQGTINIYGGTDLATAVNFKVTQIYIARCFCNIIVRGFETQTSSDSAIVLDMCSKTLIQYCTSTVSAVGYNGIYADHSTARIESCLMSNRNNAMYVLDNSNIFSYNWSSGSGNNVGIHARNNSKVGKLGTQPQGTISEQCVNGSVITSGVLNPAPTYSPAFTGTPTAPTAVAGTNTTQIATTAFVKALGDTKANTSHTHTTANVTELDTALAGKASSTHSHTINGRTLTGDTGINLEETIIVSLSDETTVLTAGAAKATFRMPYACKLTTKLPRASVNTVSSSGVINVDINKNGTSILTNRVSIDASEKTSLTATTAVSLVTTPTTFSDDDEITFDIDNAGTGAKGLKVTLFVERI